MGYTFTHISAAPTGDANGYLISVAMKNGAYVLDALTPAYGARHVTCTRTRNGAGGSEDTPGTLTIVGKDLSGQTISEVLIPGAHTVVVTGTKFFSSISSATGAGWVRDAGVGSEDTLEIGWDAVNAVAVGGGTFHGIVVNTTAAGVITVTVDGATLAVLPVSVAVGFYGPYDVAYSTLRVETAAASDITVIHSGSMPSTYAMS